MKMYVFPMDESAELVDLTDPRKPDDNSFLDVAVIRLGTFLLAWTAGAGAAALFALAG